MTDTEPEQSETSPPMQRVLQATRYLIVIPIFGLALAAAFFFIFGGFGLIRLLLSYLPAIVDVTQPVSADTHGELMYQVVEYVHTFLVGVVLYITAIGLLQLFFKGTRFNGWLKVDTTEELETNLIGVTVVVLAVNFMGAVFTRAPDLLQYGAAISLPIAALGLFVGLRAWGAKLSKEANARDPEDE